MRRLKFLDSYLEIRKLDQLFRKLPLQANSSSNSKSNMVQSFGFKESISVFLGRDVEDFICPSANLIMR